VEAAREINARSLLRDVLNSYPPQSPLEVRMCEDVTRLMLKSERIQQAQEAKLVRAYEKLANSREKQLREMEQTTSYDALQADVLEAGLRRAPDSPAKFSETAACLERLQARVESSNFRDETELRALYGTRPTFRGAGIINAFRALKANPGHRDVAASLRLMILEEMRDVSSEGQSYYREHVCYEILSSIESHHETQRWRPARKSQLNREHDSKERRDKRNARVPLVETTATCSPHTSPSPGRGRNIPTRCRTKR
jgi:hypothetical protein